MQLKAVSTVPAANIFMDLFSTSTTPVSAIPSLPVLNIGDIIGYKVTARSQVGCRRSLCTLRCTQGPDLYKAQCFYMPPMVMEKWFILSFPVGIKEIKYFQVYKTWEKWMFSSNALYKGMGWKIQCNAQPGGVYVWMGPAIDKTTNPLQNRELLHWSGRQGW